MLDITKADDIHAFARRLDSVPIDLLVNNAGIKG